MRVLVSPDKFKGTLTAGQVADGVIRGLRRTHPEIECTPLPVADGGDGTVDAFCSAGYRRRLVTTHDALGRAITAAIAIDSPDGGSSRAAVVELAQAGGLAQLDRPAPMRASTEGVGELLLAAAAAGAQSIMLGLGGSASSDGGAGVLRALGARLLDRDGAEIGTGGGALRDLDRVDLRGLAPLPPIVIAGDVDNPLLGPTGAAAVFAPQKGADPAEVAALEAGLRHWAEVLSRATGVDLRATPGAGAAGGVGFGVLTALGARMQPGISVILDLLDFDRQVVAHDVVVTGEGALDAQTLRGKAVSGVADRARQHGVPVVAVAGVCLLDDDALHRAGICRAYALTDVEPDEQRCREDAGRLIEVLASTIDLDSLLLPTNPC